MTDIDPRLVRLLARHFNDLRGWHTVAAGAGMTAMGAGWLATRTPIGMALSAGFALIAILWPIERLTWYYAERFGRVMHDDKRMLYTVLVPILASIVLERVDHASGISVFWFAWSLYPAWLVLDGWPYRTYQLVAAAAGVLAGIAGFHASSFWEGFAQGWLVVGPAEIVCGFADHALLVRAMRSRGMPLQAPSLTATDWRSDK